MSYAKLNEVMAQLGVTATVEGTVLALGYSPTMPKVHANFPHVFPLHVKDVESMVRRFAPHWPTSNAEGTEYYVGEEFVKTVKAGCQVVFELYPSSDLDKWLAE
jgi:hypothetical protein